MSRPTRILGVGAMYPPHHLGGYEVMWQAATRALRERGHTVRVLATGFRREEGAAAEGPEDPDVHRELRWYWHEHEFPEMGIGARLGLERHNRRVLARHMAELQPDLVVWWAMGGMSLAMLEQVRRAGVPALGVVGDSWMDYGFERDGWLRAWRTRPRLARAAEIVTRIPTRVHPGPLARWLFISDAIRETSCRVGGWELEDTAIVHPGIDPARFAPRPLQAWRWALLYAGRIDERKGIATAIRALPQLPSEAVLTVDGGGDDAHGAQLRALVDELGLGGRVRFVRSARDRLDEAYAAADALIFPVTWEEPWGLVPLEAMSVGRPVVATGTGGSAEYLRDGDNCLLFAPGDEVELAGALRRLAADEDLRRRLVAGGQRAASRFTEDAYHEILDREVRDRARRSG